MKNKIGIIIPIVSLLFVGYLFSINFIDEKTISNEDVKKNLEVINLKLDDSFKILYNDLSGMPERIQKTKIEISNADKQKIISEISNSKKFKNLSCDDDFIEYSNKENRYSSHDILNYKYPDFYSRELYTYIDNIPTRIIIKLDFKSNIMKYQKIED